MPFDFKKFDAKCANMSIDELQREWQHYTRLISGSATSTAVSGAAIPFTLGVSAIGVGLAAPAIHNARKKREIIERHLQRLGTTHHTRKRDVLTPMAISGTVGLVTLGVASGGAGAITNAAIEHGITSIAANEIAVEATIHLAVGGVAMAGEEHHMRRTRLAEAHNTLVRQREKENAAVVEKLTQPAISVYDPSGFGDQSHTAVDTGHGEELKYEYRPAPTSTPMFEFIPPPYSPPADGQYQYYSSTQQYSDKPDIGNHGIHHPILQNCNSDTKYYVSSTEPAQPQPQPCSEQTPSGAVNRPPADEWQHQPQSLYPQQSAQPMPQLMYPSYPTSVIPNSAQEQYGRLEQVMSELSISTTPSVSVAHVTASMSRASTPRPPAPTSRGYCSQLQQTRGHNTSYFPPLSPLSPAPLVYYPQASNITSLVPPIAQYQSPAVPPRSPSISSVSSHQSYLPLQEQSTTYSQYGYMTPIPTPGSYDTQSQPQKYSSVASPHLNQLPPPQPQMPSAVQLRMNEHRTSIQTPQSSESAPRQNHSESLQQQSSYFQPVFSQYSPQAPIQGNWQISQDTSNSHGRPHASRGYITPAATPSYSLEQQKQSTYFLSPPPPPPIQSAR